MQGRSQPHSPGWTRVPLSSFFPQILINDFYFFLKLYSFSSSFWSSGWATRPPGKALATPLTLWPMDKIHLVVHPKICACKIDLKMGKTRPASTATFNGKAVTFCTVINGKVYCFQKVFQIRKPKVE